MFSSSVCFYSAIESDTKHTRLPIGLPIEWCKISMEDFDLLDVQRRAAKRGGRATLRELFA